MNLANTADPSLRWLCIDAAAVDDVDYSAAETIRSLHGVLKDKGIRLVIAHVLEDVEAESRYHMLELFGEGTFYATVGEVVKEYQRTTVTTVPPDRSK
jgi:MFS superfamily sulfate permease-like transporter